MAKTLKIRSQRTAARHTVEKKKNDAQTSSTDLFSWGTVFKLLVLVSLSSQIFWVSQQRATIPSLQQFFQGTTDEKSGTSTRTSTTSTSTKLFQNDHVICQQLSKLSSSNGEDKDNGNGNNDNDDNDNDTTFDNFGFNFTTKQNRKWIPPSTAQLWSKYLPEIIQGSKLKDDNQFEGKTRPILYNLLLDFPPKILQRGLKTKMPQRQLERIFQILQQKKEHPTTSPPLKILVMGGSVTEGVGCKQDAKIDGRTCCWPVRLEQMLNYFLGYEGVQVTNMASGGTNTYQALNLVQYWLFPPSVLPQGPDIIIHAYGTNDGFIGGSFPEDEGTRISIVTKGIVDRLNSFIQAVRRSSPCPPPILIFLDDYFGGHSQGALFGDMTYNMIMTKITQWYHLMAISSADVLRESIYADPKIENVLSPPWQFARSTKNQASFGQNPHFRWGGHQMVAWVFLYNILDSLVDYCQQEDTSLLLQSTVESLQAQQQQQPPKDMTDNNEQENDSKEGDFIRHSQLTNRAQEIFHKHVSPPPLNFSLRLEDVSQQYKEQEKLDTQHCESVTTHEKPCPFAFVCGPEGLTRFKAGLAKYLTPFVATKENWGYDNDMSHGWSRRLGLVAQQPNAVLEFAITNTSVPVQYLTIHSLKSYGDKWKDSRVHIQIYASSTTEKPILTKNENENDNADTSMLSQTGTLVGEDWIEGVHNSTSSITYNTRIMIKSIIPKHHSIGITIRLVGGSTFKITGMMLCSH